MATDLEDPHSLEPGIRWIASHPAIERTFQPAPEVSNGSSSDSKILESLVHPAYPFVAVDVASGAGFSGRLRDVAQRYLERIIEALPEAAAFAQTQWEGAVTPWDWYGLRWGTADLDAGQPDSRLSFWVEVDAAGQQTSRTAVLLAGPQWRTADSADPQKITGGGQGLRVVLHVDPPGDNGQHVVRVTGATFARPPVVASQWHAAGLGRDGFVGLLAVLRTQLEAKLGPYYSVREVSVLSPGLARIAGSALAGTPQSLRVMSWALQVTRASGTDADPADYRSHYDYLVEQVTHATQARRAADQDPASSGPPKSMAERRPTRNEHTLSRYLQNDSGLPPSSGNYRELQGPANPPRITVQGTHLSQNTYDPIPSPQRVPAIGLVLRSDDQAAAHAYLRGLELMERLDDSGLKPENYFRFAKLPLILRHHAAMRKGNPDGHSVNAQVQTSSAGQSFTESFDAALRPQLEVRFGATSLTHRDMGSTFQGRRRPQYMGLAADRRWAWHEFGHVLSGAATGALELAFAHSAGDALAAILNDPESQLAHDSLGSATRDEPAAGLTFPWVPIKRRHNRDASLGWCWCGRRNTRRLSPLPPGARIFTGYFAEQLLSSTLFRLYRALGGDAKAPPVRHKAADYTAYLIMRALQLLGPSTCVPASQATHFFDSLVQADVATTTWHYPMSDPSPVPATVRIGGMAHKVIRWAFEQQGLFAAEHPGEVVEGIGRPPEVDIHVFGDGSTADGGYGPHPVDWIDATDVPAPGWHASAQGLAVQSGQLLFKVRNRGSKQADGVTAQAWVAKAGAAMLHWEPLQLSQDSNTVLSIGAGGSNKFKFDAELAGSPLKGCYFLLASTSCSADRSCLDPFAALPCAGAPPSQPQWVAELVSGDNNIGLVLLDLP